MKKMPCLFVRVFHDRRSFTITPEVTPGCEWVLAGEGVATRKWDGTACAVIGGRLFKRYDAKKNPKTGEYKMPPEGSIACDVPDPETGHWPHWVAVGDEPESKHHRAAWAMVGGLADGTYELCGPSFNANPEDFGVNNFVRHGDMVLDVPRAFDGLRAELEARAIEGIVFRHPDGRMCKIRRADFGLPWGARSGKATS